MADPAGNILYCGDNLDVLRRHIKDESVDLVYLGVASAAGARSSRAAHTARLDATVETWRTSGAVYGRRP